MSRPAYSDEHTEAIRQELTDGALALFRQKGTDSLTLRKLAAHLDTSHTRLYKYFDNKASLLEAVKLAILEKLQKMLIDGDNIAADPLTRLHRASHILHDFATQNKDEYLFLFREDDITQDSDTLTQKRHEVFNHIVEIAKIAHKEGYTELDGRTLANLSWATLHGLFLLNFNGQLTEGRTFNMLLESAITVLFKDQPVDS